MPRKRKKSFIDYLNLKGFNQNVNLDLGKNQYESSFVQDDRKRTAKARNRRNKFLFARKRAIETGLSNPITPEEQQNASRDRNFLGSEGY